MRVAIGKTGRVDCRAAVDVPLSAGRAWGQLRDFARFASHDYFHAGIRIDGGTPRRGAGLVIEHRYLCFRTERVGRILRWREFAAASGDQRPAGYTFSDLSRRGPRHGFPHVLGYSLRPAGARRCTVDVVVRGRWTAGYVPRWAARLWLWWVFAHIVQSVRNDLFAVAASTIAPPAPRPTPGQCASR